MRNKGFKHSEETKEKIRQSHLGFKHSDETKKKMSVNRSGEKHNFYGKHHSEETKQKIRIKRLGKRHTLESKKKIGLMSSLRRHSPQTIEKMKRVKGAPEWRQKIALAHLGKPSGMKGKHQKLETRQQISQKMMGVNKKTHSVIHIIAGSCASKVAGYRSLHDWIKSRLPKPQSCQMCNKRPPKHLSNISGRYLVDLTDWQWLCTTCHAQFDRANIFTFLKYANKII